MYNYGIQYFYLFFNFKFNIIISLTAWMQADQFISMPVLKVMELYMILENNRTS